jgi:hypothetical protein
LRFQNGLFHGFGIVSVDFMYHMPVVGLETFGRIVGKPAFGFTINGDAVVIVKADQFAQPRVPASELTSCEIPSIRQPSPINT